MNNKSITLKQKCSRGNHIDVSSKSISQLVVTKVNLNFCSLNYLSCRECQNCFSRVSAARLDANGPYFYRAKVQRCRLKRKKTFELLTAIRRESKILNR